MNKKAIILALLSSTVIISCNKSENKRPTAQPAVKVEAMAAAMSDVNGSTTYSGTIEESSGTILSFPVSGTLKSISVSEGDRVVRGQLIATLDQATLQNTYDIAKSTLDQVQDAYNRMKKLHDANSLPDMQWVEIENQLKQAQSAEAIAARALKDASIYAPVSGYVAERYMEPGMTVAPVAPVVKIVAIDPIKVNVSIPENEIASLQIGQKSQITVGAIGGAQFEGTITERGVAANPLSRTYNVKIKVANPTGQLLPGMICDVQFDCETPQDYIVLPMSAVLLDADNKNFVWLKRKGRAVKRVVTIGGITDRGLTIQSGIHAGDSVIVNGQQKVSEGTPVVSI